MILWFLISYGIAVELSNLTISTLLQAHTLSDNLLGNSYFNITLEPDYIPGTNSIFWICPNGGAMFARTACSAFYSALPQTPLCADEPPYEMLYYIETTWGTRLQQSFTLPSTGFYLLNYSFIPPDVQYLNNFFTVSINTVVVDTFQVSWGQWIRVQRQLIVQLDEGINTLSFDPQNAQWSMMMKSVTLQRFVPPKIDQFKNSLETVVLNKPISAINKIPGNRAFLYTLTNFLCFFDRLQFYYYHNQNFSESAQTFLSIVNILQNEKSNYPQEIVQECQLSVCTSFQEVYENIMEVLDKKKAYSDQEFLEKNENGVGFMANFLDYFFYELPVMVLIFLLLNLLFRLLFNYRISVTIRKYSLWGALFLVFYEGNMEQFSFYYFLEMKNFFSLSPLHKGTNIFVIFFFGIAVIFGVGGLIFFKYHYYKLAKYLIDESKGRRVPLLVLEQMQKSIFPFLFGCVHALFRDSLGLQTIILSCLEVGYFTTKLINIRSEYTSHRFRVLVLSITSLLRMVFIVTLFFFQTSDQPEIINEIHKQFVWIYIGTCALEFSIDVFLFLQVPLKQILIYAQTCFKNKFKKEKERKMSEKHKLQVKEKARAAEKVDSSQEKSKKEEQKWSRFKNMKKKYFLQGKPVKLEVQIIEVLDKIKKSKERQIDEMPKEEKHNPKNKVTFKKEYVAKKQKQIEESLSIEKRGKKSKTQR